MEAWSLQWKWNFKHIVAYLLNHQNLPTNSVFELCFIISLWRVERSCEISDWTHTNVHRWVIFRRTILVIILFTFYDTSCICVGAIWMNFCLVVNDNWFLSECMSYRDYLCDCSFTIFYRLWRKNSLVWKVKNDLWTACGTVSVCNIIHLKYFIILYWSER